MDSNHIGVLSNNEQSPSLKPLMGALSSLGVLTICSEVALIGKLDERFNLFVVNASGLQMNLAERVAWLHARFPETPIIVLTSSPTWRRARAVLRAGASDYMSYSIQEAILLDRCRSLLNWTY